MLRSEPELFEILQHIYREMDQRSVPNAIYYALEQMNNFFQSDGAVVYTQQNGRLSPEYEAILDTTLYPLPLLSPQWLDEVNATKKYIHKSPLSSPILAPFESLPATHHIVVPLHYKDLQLTGALVVFSNRAFKYEHFITPLITLIGVMLAQKQPASQVQEESVLYRTDQIRRQQAEFMRLAKDERLNTVDLVPAMQMLCESTAHTLGASRTSIWLKKKEGPSPHFENITMYSKDTRSHSKEEPLRKQQYPTYFEAIEEERTVTIEDTRQDDRVNELQDIYFYKNNIKALLDAPILCNGKSIGVLCVEHTEPRQWNFEEEAFVSSIADLTAFVLEHIERKKAEDEVRKLAYTEPLTQLPNRNQMEALIEEKIATVQEQTEQFAAIYIDLDQFWKVNEALGYKVGDQLILAITKRLRQLLESGEQLGRLDGDSFLVLTSVTEDHHSLYRRIHTFKQAFNEAFKVNDQGLFLTCSIGISFYPAHGDYSGVLIQNAHRATNEAKQMGRNVLQVYQDSMEHQSKERLIFEMNLMQGLEKGQFQLYYQPQIDLFTKKVVGLEALIRWHHHEHGLVSPGDFIPLAEITGHIVPIGKWVIEEAARQLKEWTDMGYENLTVSVNISPRQFQQGDLPDVIQRAIDTTGISPEGLIIEITESLAMENQDLIMKQMESIRDIGCCIAIDDFGSGYSSLRYLQHFPIQSLKIDRRFVENISSNEKDAAIAQTMINLAKNLELSVVAEGIEEIDQLKALRKMDCHQVQGFLISRPLPVKEITKWMRDYTL
ncbi:MULTISPECIES: sensor domain-containing phosphodiesterase [Pontibacillus]|uniref:GGDEF and EAL domain-containing protein n=1 Tax=Pontibacillus chungwhensis TaxID=265426 RepID=A0ABY8V492_9BACI|nr:MULTISPECIES: GGDEF and EAL domain-containing protein [Pontibacillus]MCD5325542.1 GGDEF and EAL domain-containing protein [Pontibacillus sp. HN14]WIF98651.1 GGDEF and EAL domain-containing protein [Pontibacillus chungwhensis]